MQETADAKGQRSGRAGIRNQPAWFDRRDSAFQSRTPWGGSRARCDDRVCAGRNADNLAHPCSRMDRRTGWISRIRLERKRSASLSAGSWCNWAYRFAFVRSEPPTIWHTRVAGWIDGPVGSHEFGWSGKDQLHLVQGPGATGLTVLRSSHTREMARSEES